MPKPKVFLKDLFRTKPRTFSRIGYLRLDMNEGIPGLPEDFILRVTRKINSELLSSYPEYAKIHKKLALHARLKPEYICMTAGSVAAIKYIFDAYISKNDKVLLTDPTFAMYPVYCKMFGAMPVVVKYKPDLSFPAEDFIKRIGGDIKLAIIVNPNNPTGSVIAKDDLVKIVKKAQRHDVIVIMDEAYFFFYPATAIRLVKRYKNLIIIRTFSKLCGLAGLRFGYAAAAPEIINNLNKVKVPYEVNNLAVLFVDKLLDDYGIIRKLIIQANMGKKYLMNRLSQAGIEYIPGHANFILIKCDNNVKGLMRLLKRNKILVAGGFPQKLLKSYLRVTCADKESMKKFWRIFIRIRNTYNV